MFEDGRVDKYEVENSNEDSYPANFDKKGLVSTRLLYMLEPWSEIHFCVSWQSLSEKQIPSMSTALINWLKKQNPTKHNKILNDFIIQISLF